MPKTAPEGGEHGRIACFSAQAVVEGQDSWAAVMEVIGAFGRLGWRTDVYCPRYAPGRVPSILTRVIRIAAAELALAARIRRYEAAYVRVHPFAWPVAMWARICGVTVVQESNGSWEDAFVAWPALRAVSGAVKAVQRSQYRHADAIIAVSEGLADWIANETGRDDVMVSPNGANAQLFRPDAVAREGLPARYVVFFGQFAAWQRLDVLLEAAGRPEWPDGVDLVVVGDGALRPLVERAVVEHDHVHYLGQLPYDEVPGVVAHALAATVLTFAPERAGYSPLKLYEAMACGVPVVCSDTPGQAEFVREDSAGIVVPPDDTRAVALAVAALAADEAKARAMGERGRAAVEAKYSWDARARQRLEAVERALERRQRRGR